LVVEDASVDDVGQSAFEGADGHHRGHPAGFAAVVVDAAVGGAAQWCDGHDVQRAVDAPVAGAGQTVSLLVAGGGVQGAVPFQDADRSRLAKRWMSPSSASRRAASAGPMPCKSSRVGPRSITNGTSSFSTALI
jgi:hypothetical protein